MTVLTNTTPSSTRSAAFGGKRDFAARVRRASMLAGVLLGVLALVATGVLTTQSPAEAAGSATTSPSPTSGSSDIATPTPTPPVAQTIEVADSDSDRTTARGTATPGANLRVLDPVHPASSLCTVTTATDGSWSCRVSVTSGAGQRLTVRDLTDTAFPDVTSAPFSVLTAPVLTTSPGVTVGARVSGTGYPGATVTTTLTNSASGAVARVKATADSSGAWQVLLPSRTVPTGSYVANATQSSAAITDVPVSSTSASISITIDRQAPAPPTIAHPAAGSTVSTQPLVFDGTGENGDTVTTYVDSNPVCTAVVRGGRWSCTSTGLLIPSGPRNVQAAQRDAAGNYGAPSTGSRVLFAVTSPATPSATPSASAPGVAPSEPQPSSSPSAEASAPASPGAGGTPGGGASGGTPSQGGSSGGGAPGAGSSGGGEGLGGGTSPAEASSWTGSTGFGRNLPTLSEGLGGWSWVWALALGLVFVLLVLAPLRLAATALGGRLAMRVHHITGRNRARTSGDDSPAVSPIAAAVAALAVGALLVALAAGVDDQVRYVRLAVAIIVGLGLLNGLGIVLPSLVAGRRLGLRPRVRVSPQLLVAAALACLVTRIVDLDPPMVLGVLLTAGLVDAAGHDREEAGDVRRGGILAIVQLSSLALVSFAAWLVHGLLPVASTDFAVEISRETLATVCLAGLGSLILLLVPLGRLPGRALYSWSRPTLVGLVVVGVAMAAVVYAGDPDEAFPMAQLVIAAVVFAVVALSTWVWVRFVEPAADDLV